MNQIAAAFFFFTANAKLLLLVINTAGSQEVRTMPALAVFFYFKMCLCHLTHCRPQLANFSQAANHTWILFILFDSSGGKYTQKKSAKYIKVDNNRERLLQIVLLLLLFVGHSGLNNASNALLTTSWGCSCSWISSYPPYRNMRAIYAVTSVFYKDSIQTPQMQAKGRCKEVYTRDNKQHVTKADR